MKHVRHALWFGLGLVLPCVTQAAVKIAGEPTDYVQITNALFKASPGAEILVSTGAYDEAILIGIDCSIRGGFNEDCSVHVEGATSTVVRAPAGKGVITISGANVTLEDLYITGGDTKLNGGGIFAEYSSLTVKSCRVCNNMTKGYGGGVYLGYASTAYITNTVVSSNQAFRTTSGDFIAGCGGGIAVVRDSVLTLADRNSSDGYGFMRWNFAEDDGGGIYVCSNSQAYLSGEHGDILTNTATRGGGTAAVSGSLIELSDGLDVCGNIADTYGGGFFFDAASTGRLHGAGIMIGSESYSLGPNTVTNGDGAGIACIGSRLELYDGLRIGHNLATGDGGGIYCDHSTLLASDLALGYDAVGYTNLAAYGGGLYARFSTVTLTNGTVIRNAHATGYGGATYLYYCDITAENLTIVSNSATSFGGGFCALYSTVTGRFCTISDNRALSNAGGGMRLIDTESVWTDLVVSNNTARHGGGLAFVGGDEHLYIGGNSLFCDNHADRYGGGLYIERSTATLSGVTFTRNSATTNGGGLAVSNGYAQLYDCILSHNTADVSGASGGLGGGAWAHNNSYLGLAATGGVCGVFSNKAYGGSGLAADHLSMMDVYTLDGLLEIAGNHALREGGGILVTNSSLRTSGNVRIYANRANNEGGGLSLRDSSTMLWDATIGADDAAQGNYATNEGGGVFCRNGMLRAHQATIVNNEAQYAGGGIRLLNGSCAISNTTIALNRITGSSGGGAGLCQTYSDGHLYKVVFSGNVAEVVAGGFYGLQGLWRMDTCAFIENVSSNAGGFMLSNATGCFDRVVIEQNRADQYGGGAMLGANSSLWATNCSWLGNVGDADSNFDARGGALWASNARIEIRDTTGNRIAGNSSIRGGGICLETNVYLRIVGNLRIESNTCTFSGFGGGMYTRASTAELFAVYMKTNTAFYGGGIYARENSIIKLRDSLLALNQGDWGAAAWLNGSQGDFTSCTVVSNGDYGIEWSSSGVNLDSCIVYYHGCTNVQDGATVSNSCIQGDYFGSGNFDTNPCLLAHNYHLSYVSPCRDAGRPSVGMPPDVDGEPRTGLADVGFDEFVDTDNDGLPNVVETGTGTWVNDADMGSDPNVADSDGDGVEDGIEWQTDTNPNDPTMFLRFTSVEHSSGICHDLRWVGGTQAIQRIEVSNAITNGTWGIYTTRRPPTAGNGYLSRCSTDTNCFFRITAFRYPPR